MKSKKISKTRPRSSLDHTQLGTFHLCQHILIFMYKLTLHVSMKSVHPVFHVSFLRQQKPELIIEPQQPEPKGKVKWEVKDILDCKRKHINLSHLVSYRVCVTQHKLWEPRDNFFFSELMIEFGTIFPYTAAQHQRTRIKQV